VSTAGQFRSFRHILFDTGTNGNINFRDVVRWLLEACESNTRITVANGKHMKVGMDGILPIRVLSTAGLEVVAYEQDFKIKSTTADSEIELLSFLTLCIDRDGDCIYCHRQLKVDRQRSTDPQMKGSVK
jgi:hypothetical protein